MKDKVRRKRELAEKKQRNQASPDDIYSNDPESYEELKRQQELEQQLIDQEKIIILEKKIELARQRAHELNQQWRKQNVHRYKSKRAFENAYQKVEKKRNKVIQDLEKQLKALKEDYKYTWETGAFKTKRWFFGMGKEFSRISWAKKKEVWIGFLIVVIISLLLALIFLGIDSLISIKL